MSPSTAPARPPGFDRMAWVPGPPPVPRFGHGDLTGILPSPPRGGTRTRPKRRERRVWIGSLLGHAIGLVVMVLLISPARRGWDRLAMTARWANAEEDMTEAVFTSLPAAADPTDAAVLPVAPEPVAASPVSTAGTNGEAVIADGATSASGSPTPELSPGAGTSFFGLTARGQRFVYVLDRSRSMRAGRLDRAKLELIESLRRLESHQSFYVLLFNDSADQMFGRQDIIPSPVRATDENIDRLIAWLADIDADGGTDPRRALGTALRMSADAIFMLSDGEFSDDRPLDEADHPLFGVSADADTLDVVRSAGTARPVHSIAFEDAKSCKSMRQIAELTGGEYVFKASPTAMEAEERLNRLTAETPADASPSDLRKFVALAELDGRFPAGEKSLEQLTRLAIERFEAHLAEGNLIEAARVTAVLVAAPVGRRPTPVVEARSSLIQRLTHAARGDSGVANKLLVAMDLTSADHQAVPSLGMLALVAVEADVDEIESSAANGEFSDALGRLGEVAAAYPSSAINTRIEQLVAGVKTRLRREADRRSSDRSFTSAIEWLRDIKADLPPDLASPFRIVVDQQIDHLIGEMLVVTRMPDARRSGRAAAVEAELREMFGDSQRLRDARIRSIRSERQARSRYRSAMRLLANDRISDAVAQLRQLRHEHPQTVIAGLASDKLFQLGITHGAIEPAGHSGRQPVTR